MNGTLESQRILRFQGLECMTEDLARPITGAGKRRNAENPIFMLAFLLIWPSLYVWLSGLSWQNFSGFCFTSKVRCFHLCGLASAKLHWELFGWNSWGLRLCESNLMKRHIYSTSLLSFQVLQACGNCNSCYVGCSPLLLFLLSTPELSFKKIIIDFICTAFL